MKNRIIKIYLSVFMFLSASAAFACDACKKLQPKAFQGITHGRGPDSNWDYLIVTIMVIVTLYVLVATVKCIMRPSEQQDEHIKRSVLNY